MVRLGQRVRFVPSVGIKDRNGGSEYKPSPVIGRVAHVNMLHSNFTVEYSVRGVRLREGFHFVDLGETVHCMG